MAYGPGVNEINYADLPPTGDTVNSAFQKTQNQFDALYTGLNNDIVRASEAEVNTATDTTKLITPGTLLKGKANGVASLDALGKVTNTELPLASETVKGVVKVGANINGTEGTISVPEATDAVKGVVKVGANISLADGVISVPDATDTVKGMVELATSAEVLAGVDEERAVTPATLTAKILGTVSEVNGVPTGAIIESGSNSNGFYTKFADGIMIMNTNFAPFTADASVIIEKSWTFPVSFIGTDYFSNLTSQPLSNSDYHGTVYVVKNSKTSVKFGVRNGATTQNINSYCFAIGRWY